MTTTISFTECEHNGDLDNYVQDLISSGAKVISSEVNPSEEMGYVRVSIGDKTQFMKQFMETDSYDFSTLAQAH